jgi:hypothetical protein
MPGCATQGRSRDEALANAREAIELWLEGEADFQRGPLPETPALVAAGVSEALEIIDEMREAGEIPANHGYELELATVEVNEPVLA